MLMALVETGTRGVPGGVVGPPQTSETAYEARLLRLLDRDMPLLPDRGFDSSHFLEAVAATGSQFLTRCRSYRRPPVLAVLDDGSYLTQIASLRLRVLAAEVKANGADGSTSADRYRLITTLTGLRTDPAPAQVRLHHERWEIESVFLALRHTLLRGRVLRSKNPPRNRAGGMGPVGAPPGEPTSEPAPCRLVSVPLSALVSVLARRAGPETRSGPWQ